MAKQAANSLLFILNDILDLSKIEANLLQLEEIEFDTMSTIQRVVQLLSITNTKDIYLRLNIHNLASRLIGDPTRLGQLLQNLVSNAMKFTTQGGVDVTIQGRVCNNYYELTGIVVDTGIGISEAGQKRLFQQFSQADSSITRHFGGTGLGLYVTKKLCNLMGGDVHVFSTLGEGSKFWFEVHLQLPPTSLESQPKGAKPRKKLPPLRILVAEDNLINQIVIRRMLEQNGCSSITIVPDGKQALEAAQQASYDLVLMDVQMPVMDGMEATTRLRKLFPADDLPIIGVTAYVTTEDREKLGACGMNGCLAKPINSQALIEEILQCVRRTQDVASSNSCSQDFHILFPSRYE